MGNATLRDLKISRALHLFRYVQAVAKEIGERRAWSILESCITDMALEWYKKNRKELVQEKPLLEHAFDVYYFRHLNLNPKDVEIVEKSENRLVCRWRNFCEVLEACKMLGLDTRIVCKEVYETPGKTLLKQISPALNFRRNYDKIRPYADFCEEIIEII
jgi:hypothetical protein